MALSDEQKIILHMCMQAEKTGHDTAWISRDDILRGDGMPKEVRGTAIPMKMMWAVLTMPAGVLEWSADQQRFRMSIEAIRHVVAKMKRRLESTTP